MVTAYLVFKPVATDVIDGRPPSAAMGTLRRQGIRLVPVYYVAVIVVWFSRNRHLPGDWRDLLEHLTFTQGLDHKRIFYTIGPAWAVSAIVVIYLLLAASIWAWPHVAGRAWTRRQRALLVSALPLLLAAISLTWKGWSLAVAHRPVDASFTTWFGPIATLDNFAIGMAVAVYTGASPEVTLQRRSRVALRAFGLAVLAAAICARHTTDLASAYFSTVCSLDFAAFLAAAVLAEPRPRRGRARLFKVPSIVGAMSYSLYLWHEPVMLGLRRWPALVRQSPRAFLTDARSW